jgi:hypothetical protein
MRAVRPWARILVLRVVVNHLRFKEPVPNAVVDAAEEVCQRLVEAGGLAASLIQVDEGARRPAARGADGPKLRHGGRRLPVIG